MSRSARVDISTEEEIRKRVTDYIQNNGISQRKFAELAGIDPVSLSGFLSRKKHLGECNYEKIKEALTSNHNIVKIDITDPNAVDKVINLVTKRKEYLETEIKSTEEKLAKLKAEYDKYQKLEVKNDD